MNVQYSVSFHAAGAQGDIDTNMERFIPPECGLSGVQFIDFQRGRYIYLEKSIPKSVLEEAERNGVTFYRVH